MFAFSGFSRVALAASALLMMLGTSPSLQAQTVAPATVSALDKAVPYPSPLVGADYRLVQQQIARGQWQNALQAANQHLQNHPNDPQMRLLKSRILQGLGQNDQALQEVLAITQQYPEIAEPFNNLATLYAQRGQIEAARLALEQALKLNSGYTIARENLGDIYLRMAHDLYAQALNEQPNNAALRAKVQSTSR